MDADTLDAYGQSLHEQGRGWSLAVAGHGEAPLRVADWTCDERPGDDALLALCAGLGARRRLRPRPAHRGADRAGPPGARHRRRPGCGGARPGPRGARPAAGRVRTRARHRRLGHGAARRRQHRHRRRPRRPAAALPSPRRTGRAGGGRAVGAAGPHLRASWCASSTSSDAGAAPGSPGPCLSVADVEDVAARRPGSDVVRTAAGASGRCFAVLGRQPGRAGRSVRRLSELPLPAPPGGAARRAVPRGLLPLAPARRGGRRAARPSTGGPVRHVLPHRPVQPPRAAPARAGSPTRRAPSTSTAGPRGCTC